MSDIILPVAGAAAGFALGGFNGAVLGANLGSGIHSSFLASPTRLPTRHGIRLTDLRIQTSTYGKTIPTIYGSMRLAGNIIWSTDIKEVTREQNHSAGGKGGATRTTSTSVTYEYFVTLAIALCEGEIDEIVRAWADSKVLTEDILSSAQGKYNIHLGAENQPPDDIIAKYKSPGSFSAYRGLAYIVIEDFPLAQFGNRIPNFTFEVKRSGTLSVEKKIKDIVLIPGAGEMVYSTTPHTKQDGHQTTSRFVESGEKSYINVHNYESKADVLVALDQMQRTLPALEWVALVVTWFATDTDAATCDIVPKVEFHGSTQIKPYNWKVAGISRNDAEKVLYIDDTIPTYGGTPSDHTVIEICKELHHRKLKVLLYPMVFVDQLTPDKKPWRGRITPKDTNAVTQWFTKEKGYNAFILHYASLTSGLVDGFVIGSEMIGMTQFHDKKNHHPTVDHFITLARKVKQSLASHTLVTYAADWSEYHSYDGWFYLDKLWADDAIDIVGIDAYFPLTTDIDQQDIHYDNIKSHWSKGEGWDYYWNTERTQKHSYSHPQYAWKNLAYWWSHTHTNPDGKVTAWKPKMKPVWFTEFGFPSVDGCSNQPNVFYDPGSVESFFPRKSHGQVDFYAQRQAIEATLDFLEEQQQKDGNAELIPRRFLWCWDARPFSFWPDLEGVWHDSNLWRTGHWVQGKLGNSTLALVVASLLEKAGLRPGDYDVSALTGIVDGYIVQEQTTIRHTLEQLTAIFLFDIVESDGILKCVPRQQKSALDIPYQHLVPTQNKDIQDLVEITYAHELALPQKITVNYLDRPFNYNPVNQSAARSTVNTINHITLQLAMVLSASQARRIADIMLYNAWQERIQFSCILPPQYAYIEPGDVITLSMHDTQHTIRVTKTDNERNGLLRIYGVASDISIYSQYNHIEDTPYTQKTPTPIADTYLLCIDAPPLPAPYNNSQKLLMATAPNSSEWSGAVIYSAQNNDQYALLESTKHKATFGAAITTLNTGKFVSWDSVNTVDIILTSGILDSKDKLSVLNGSNAAILGNELIQFRHAKLVSEHTYRLSMLLRGRQGTEWAIPLHQEGENFVLLSPSLLSITMANHMIGKDRLYKAVSIGKSLATTQEQSFQYKACNLKPLSPVHLKSRRDDNGNIHITWVRRARTDNDWRDHVDVPLDEQIEAYEIDIIKNKRTIRTIITNVPFTTYTHTQQHSDFGSRADHVDICVYQISQYVGRGYGVKARI